MSGFGGLFKRRIDSLGSAAGVGLQRSSLGLLLLAVVALSARLFGTVAAGQSGLAMSLASAMLVIADFGGSSAAAREFSLRPPSRFELLRLAGLKALISMPLVFLGSLGIWAVSPGLGPAGTAAMFSVPPMAATAVVSALFISLRRGRPLAAGAAGGAASGIVFLLLVPSSGPSWLPLMAIPLSRAVELCVLIILTGLRTSGDSKRRYGLSWMAGSWPIAAQGMLAMVYQRSTLLVAAPIVGQVGTGRIAEGLGLYGVAALGPSVVSAALFPSMIRAARAGASAVGEFRGNALLAMLLVLPAAAALVTAPEAILLLMFKSTSADLIAFTRWCGVALLLIGPNSMIAFTYLSHGQERELAFLSAVTTFASVALVAVGALIAGVPGVGWSVAMSEAVTALVFGGRYVLRRRSTGPKHTSPPLFHEFRLSSRRAPRDKLAWVAIAASCAGGLTPVFLVWSPEIAAYLGPGIALVALVFGIKVFHYDVAAPAPLFGLVWFTAVTVAQLPFFGSYTWGLETWLLVSVPPAVLVLTAAIGAGTAPINRKPLAIKFSGGRLFGVVIVAFLGVGSAVTIYEYQQAGGIPLLATEIDAARVQLVANPFLHFFTRMVPAAVALSGVAFIQANRRWRVLYGSVSAVGTIVFLGQAGRLHLILPLFVVGMVAYFVIGLTRRALVIGLIGLIATIAVLSQLFFYRIEQHQNLPFESYLYETVLATRPEPLGWTVPIQLGLSGSLFVLSNLVDAQSFNDGLPGLYMLHGAKRYLPAKDSQLLAQSVTGALITSTYLADPYGDFGLLGATVWSAACGLIYGRMYQFAVRGQSRTGLVIYAYAAFWLCFFVYFNIWTYEIFWIVDLLLIWLGLRMMRRHGETEKVLAPAIASSFRGRREPRYRQR